MFDERAFIARVEAANADELAKILMRPTAEEERALRAYLGDERYQRMHGIALRRSVRRGTEKPKGNVIVIHGIMGSELSSVNREGATEQVWVKILRLITGWIERLRLSDDGRMEHNRDYDVRPTGIMKRYYGQMLLSLSESWNVRAFWFDWRKDLKLAAAELEAQIRGWFDDNVPVHILAHSMGGLVARTFIKNYPERWKTMWDEKGKGGAGGRLIMFGTPNHGSFASPQVITGLEGMVRKLALADLRHSQRELLTIINSFVGTYQMLPSPFLMKSMEPLYKSETYGDLNVLQHHLDNARNHHKLLEDVVDAERMIYIAGYNQPTFSNILDWKKLDKIDGYDVTMRGDGRVPHELGLLKTPGGKEIKTFYIEEQHADLVLNDKVLASLDELLETGSTKGLSDMLPSRRGQAGNEKTREELRKRIRDARDDDEKRFQDLAGRMRNRSVEPQSAFFVSPEERKLEESITRGFLSYQDEERQTEREDRAFRPAPIEIRLVKSGIEDIDKLNTDGEPVDVIAVGHYLGVRPQAAELMLDKAISDALPGKATHSGAKDPDADLILTQYTDRGILIGELGQLFFLNDPRTAKGKNGGVTDRIVAIAGMGVPGRFGMPELIVLSRELCWALGRMGKRHLATVLIGAGSGNLSADEAVSAWISGVKHALTGSIEDEGRRLKRITFVEYDPRRLGKIQKAILKEKQNLGNELEIDYEEISEGRLRKLDTEGLKWERRDWQKQRLVAESKKRIPTRITFELKKGSTYHFGAITEDASIPEREIPLDPILVDKANEELAAEWNPLMQVERGQFMEQLLIPDELRSQVFTDAPIVMMLDSTTARIHWEIIAQSNLTLSGDERRKLDFKRHFLGTSRGFTRQLRTMFAPPPEPPPPPRRILRVLVVADPAEDARLPGAEAEGVEVADLFESFNKMYEGLSENRVEVIRLFGPREATRTNVLRHLILRPFDVLHFAGHCIYDKQEPTHSGWIFTGGERLSANELRRIDRVPKFVFSNACESGITPDRSEMRSVDLAPTFAEEFFARGVSNFVCTAWPVDDIAARQFARRLYSGLLGLTDVGNPEAMYVAMREARLIITNTPHGVRTWGAYQHYGNPNFRLFNPPTGKRDKTPVKRETEASPSSVSQKRRRQGKQVKKGKSK